MPCPDVYAELSTACFSPLAQLGYKHKLVSTNGISIKDCHLHLLGMSTAASHQKPGIHTHSTVLRSSYLLLWRKTPADLGKSEDFHQTTKSQWIPGGKTGLSH